MPASLWRAGDRQRCQRLLDKRRSSRVDFYRASRARDSIDSNMSKTLIFVSSHQRHPKVADRMIAALAAHRKIELFSFERGAVENRVYSDPSVSHTSLGPIKDGVAVSRIFSLVHALWVLFRAKRRIKGSDTVVIVNTLELLLISWLCGLTRLPTIYDVADIHRLQLSKSIAGRCLRWLERRALKQVSLLVVSSPWFYWEYFAKWLGVPTPVILIENRVRFDLLQPDMRPTLSGRIAWNGLLRCQTSAIVLLKCLTSSPQSLYLSLHGTLDRLGALAPKLLDRPNCLYTGPYDAEALGGLLSASSFVWAVDFAEGENSKWLLPNRLYEAIAAGLPLIAVDGTATAEVVRRYNIGIVLPECSVQAVMHALDSCSPEIYASWVANVHAQQRGALRRNEWTLIFDDASRWGELRHLPGEVNAGVVLPLDAV